MIIDLNECAVTNSGTTMSLIAWIAFLKVCFEGQRGVRIAELDSFLYSVYYCGILTWPKKGRLPCCCALEIGVRHEFPTRARSLLCFALGQRSNFGCRFVSFVYGLFCYISPAVRLALLLEKKLRWYHCKPRINRVFQRRAICVFFATWGHHLWTLINQKIFRLTFQRANGLQRLRALWIRQAVLARCALQPWVAWILGSGDASPSPQGVALSIQIFGAWTFLLLFQILWGPPPHMLTASPSIFFVVFDICEITWTKCPSVS